MSISLAGGRLESVRFGRVRGRWQVIRGVCRRWCAVGRLKRVAGDDGVKMCEHMQVRCGRRLAWTEIGPE